MPDERTPGDDEQDLIELSRMEKAPATTRVKMASLRSRRRPCV
jgi:hypothetical protein